MEYIRSLESELLKIKGSIIIWVSILGALMISTVFTLRNIYIQSHINLNAEPGGWEVIFSIHTRAFIGFLIPVGVMLICALITQLEYKNNNWKQVHTTPQRYSTIFAAKFSTLMLLTGVVFFFLNLGILINGTLPCLVLDGRLPVHSVPLGHFFIGTLKCIVLSLPIIGVQFLLSLHFKNFMIAFGAGLAMYVGSMPGIKLGDIGFLSPYGYVLNYFDENIEPRHYYMALIYFVILLVSSYIMYVRKTEKG